MTNYPPPPPPQQPGYGYTRDHPRATLALVLGIISIVACSVLGPVAWAIGGRAVREIDASGGTLGGRGSAKAGQVLGIIATVLLVLGIIAVILVFAIGLGVSTNSSVGG